MYTPSEEKDYLWQHFKFNAEQRLKAFNFFVVFSVFANGGVFTAFQNNAHPALLILGGGFIIILSTVFAVIDARSQALLQLALPGLREYEKQFPQYSRLFALDANQHRKLIRYTTAFRALFSLQFLFGLAAVGFGFTR